MLIYLLYLLFGLLAIGFVIFLHELGHFTAARLLGVDVEVLSYGMGPKLFSFHHMAWDQSSSRFRGPRRSTESLYSFSVDIAV